MEYIVTNIIDSCSPSLIHNVTNWLGPLHSTKHQHTKWFDEFFFFLPLCSFSTRKQQFGNKHVVLTCSSFLHFFHSKSSLIHDFSGWPSQCERMKLSKHLYVRDDRREQGNFKLFIPSWKLHILNCSNIGQVLKGFLLQWETYTVATLWLPNPLKPYAITLYITLS